MWKLHICYRKVNILSHTVKHSTMGRIILAEENIETQILSLYGKDKWFIGLIIGQITEQKDFALHLAPTPKSEPDTNGEESSPKPKASCSLDKVDEQWVSKHARQVLRLLPGGIDVLGIFAMAPPDMMKAAQVKLRQVLVAVHKIVFHPPGGGSYSTGGSTSPSPDRILLQICPVTRKMTCRTYDIADSKSSARPADWKYQRHSDKWHRLDTVMAKDFVIPVHDTDMSKSLERQLLKGLQPLCDNIWNSIATIDQKMAAGDGLVDPNQPQGKKGKKQQDEPTGKTITVELFEIKPSIKKEDIKPPSSVPCGASLTLRGTMCCRAFVHSKATIDEAIHALKTDVIRSLTSRCELLCEDLLQSEEEQDRKVLYETPLRVFAPLEDSTVQLCDYMFPDETNNDVVDRLKELMDLTVPEDLLETDCERFPDESDLDKPCMKTKENLNDPVYSGYRSNMSKGPNCCLLALLAVLGAFLAVVVGFFIAEL